MSNRLVTFYPEWIGMSNNDGYILYSGGSIELVLVMVIDKETLGFIGHFDYFS